MLAMAIGAALVASPFIFGRLLEPSSQLAYFSLSYSGVLSTFRWLEPLGARLKACSVARLVTGCGPKGCDATAWTFALYFGASPRVLPSGAEACRRRSSSRMAS